MIEFASRIWMNDNQVEVINTTTNWAQTEHDGNRHDGVAISSRSEN